MKIIALGGAGQEGSRTVRDLADSPEVTSLVIGDLNIDAANRLKQDIGSDKVSTVQVDATDKASLIAVLKGADVVISCVGPYYRFGVPILKAVIEAGCDYVDICDDPEPTIEMLDLHEQAKQAGIVAVIGCGASPGSLNVLAADAAKRLDQVEDFHCRWNVSVADIEGDITETAGAEHAVHIVDGDVIQYLDGEWVNVPAMSASEQIQFPVLGECETYYLGHPETVTFPRYIKGVRNVTQKGGILGLDDVLRAFRELGLTGDEPLNIKGSDVRPLDVAIALLGRMPEPDPAELPPAVAEVMLIATGVKDGKSLKLTYNMTGKMGHLTGIPTSIIAKMIGAGQVTQKGVFAPEGCIDPDIFLPELAKRDIEVKFSEEAL